MTWTASGDAEVDAWCDVRVARVVTAITTAWPDASVTAVGSFGRGEATVRRAADGSLSAVSDLEVLVLPATPRRARRRLEQELSEATGIKVELIGARGYERELTGAPTLAAFDLAHASRSLAGEAPAVPTWRVEDLPAWEATRLVFNRVAEALSGDADAVAKLACACGDASLLAAGTYTPTLAGRLAALKANGAAATVLWGYERRLNVAVTPPPSDVRDVAESALLDVLARDFGWSVGDLDAAVTKYELAGDQLHARPRWSRVPVVERAASFARAARRGVRLPVAWRSGTPPVHRVYALAARAFFGLPGGPQPEHVTQWFNALVA